MRHFVKPKYNNYFRNQFILGHGDFMKGYGEVMGVKVSEP